MSPEARAQHSVSIFREIWGLLRPFLSIAIVATVLGAFSGLATASLLATVNEGLHLTGGASPRLLMQFSALCILSIGGAGIAGVANSIVGQKVISSLRKDVSRKVIDCPLETIERYKSHRILAILSNDIDTVSAFTFSFAGYIVSSAIIVGCFAYLASLSTPVFLMFLCAIVCGVALAVYSKAGWRKDYEGVRRAQDRLQEQYRAITDGAKEIRLNIDRQRSVHSIHLSGAADTIASLKISAMRRFWIADSIGSGIVFLAIGTLLAMQATLSLTATVTSGVILVMLYVRAPIEQLLNGLNAFFQAQIALRRIAEVSSALSSQEADPPQGREPAENGFKSMQLSNAVYTFYRPGGEAGFRLGPINLAINTGETLFIVGENGSGKTTLVKVLLGLYLPENGTLLVNGEPIPRDKLHAFRQMFSAVFSDYFLFADLLSLDEDIAERAQAYLEELEIAHKVDIHDDRFSTIDLSTGQRKRLALIHAYLERRPIMMFDEWAADQDPTFRRVFYERILPDLKEQGKTLIVISHDDRFFHAADHIVTLKDGVIIDESFADQTATPRPANTLS